MTALRRPASPDEFAVYAIRYAWREGRRGQHFHGLDQGWEKSHPTAYYVWLALSQTRTIVVDTGIAPDRAAVAPGLHYLGSPPDLINSLGVSPASVDTVILSHLHYDHTGTAMDFPGAEIIIQQSELGYWTGPVGERIRREHWLVNRQDIADIERRLSAGRGRLLEGDDDVAPGVRAHLLGGHTPGMQVVSFRTGSGTVVVASDAAHFYENLEADIPFEIVSSVPGMYFGFDRIMELAGDIGKVLAGHDPLVLERFPLLEDHPNVAIAG